MLIKPFQIHTSKVYVTLAVSPTNIAASPLSKKSVWYEDGSKILAVQHGRDQALLCNALTKFDEVYALTG